MNRNGRARAEYTSDTPEKYLAFEREAEEKHEFRNGKIVAMAGASERHNIIASNLFGELFLRLKNSDCRAFASDLRVKAVKSKQSNYYYPDVVITCGERKFEDDRRDVLLNPHVIIEILSKSTKLKDRNEKLESYFAIESLTDYILVEQDARRIEHFSRIDQDNWRVRLLSEKTDEIVFEKINCRIPLTDVYNEIQFDESVKRRRR